MKYIGCIILAAAAFALSAQHAELSSLFQEEQAFRQKGMMVLGSWAVVNIAGGLALRANTTGTSRYFHEMNALWNGVNLGIAAFGYFSARAMAEPGSILELYQEQLSLDKVLLFNAGLDLAYVAAGLWMNERSRNLEGRTSERWSGYGRSVMLQGAFLFAFDIALLLLRPVVDLPEQLSIGLQPGAPEFLSLRWLW